MCRAARNEALGGDRRRTVRLAGDVNLRLDSDATLAGNLHYRANVVCGVDALRAIGPFGLRLGWSCTKGGVELIISAATTLPGLGLERTPTHSGPGHTKEKKNINRVSNPGPSDV